MHATVRSTKDLSKVEHLQKLAAALPGELTFFEGDLLKPGSFDDAVKGAKYVFHCASPFSRGKPDDPQAFFVTPAVEGTKNVLSSVAKNKSTVKRVVLTSSFAAMLKISAGPENGKVYQDDVDWNTESTLTEGSYMFSKAEAEKAAWDYVKQHGIDMCVINPSFVYGPTISKRTDGESIQALVAAANGEAYLPMYAMVDVRDIARAHVRAAERPQAKGRYLCTSEKKITGKQMQKALEERFPEYSFKQMEDGESTQYADNGKIERDLGFKLTPPDVFIADGVQSVIALGLAHPKPRK